MFLVDAGLAIARMSIQDEPKDRATRFENKELFKATMRSIKDVVPIESEDDKAVPKLAEARSSKRDAEEELYQGRSKKQKIGESSKLRNKDVDELSQEELQQLMIMVPEQGMNVEALQTKYPIID
nr:ribosomal protein S1, mitochondrial [Tanacetum cinerariifolium]